MLRLVTFSWLEHINLLRLVLFDEISQGHKLGLFPLEELVQMNLEHPLVKNISLSKLILKMFVGKEGFFFVTDHNRFPEKIQSLGVNASLST